MENFMIALECSLRDGGYVNNWNFADNLVSSYLETIKKSGIQALEIGFRNPPEKIKGEYSNITDEIIINNNLNPNIKLFGVMINTSDYTPEYIDMLFKRSIDSPINMVRLATHFKDISKAEELCKKLYNLNYFICINLMQVADKSIEEIKNSAKKINRWKTINVLYLADSFGNMTTDHVKYAFDAVREEWNGPMGFHAHNNKNQALNNTLEAVDLGVEYVDCTMSGIGRGPGNCETEYLLEELNKRGFGGYNSEPVYKLVLDQFYPLKKQYEWGSNLLYYLAAEYNIHPTYIQIMMSMNLNIIDSYEILKNLKNKNSFDKKLLESFIEGKSI
jgi:4-hydroxy 2-oxovalerate aldolase